MLVAGSPGIQELGLLLSSLQGGGGRAAGQRNKDQREGQICPNSIYLKKDQLGAGHIMPTITLAD